MQALSENLYRLEVINKRIDAYEDMLRDASKFAIAFLASMPAPVWIKDKNGHYTFVNSAFSETFGKEYDEVVGKKDADIWSQDAAQNFTCHDCKIVKNGQTMHSNIKIMNDYKNQQENLDVSLLPIWNKGEIVGIGGYVRNYVP